MARFQFELYQKQNHKIQSHTGSIQNISYKIKIKTQEADSIWKHCCCKRIAYGSLSMYIEMLEINN